jgi:hypothetical protein
MKMNVKVLEEAAAALDQCAAEHEERARVTWFKVCNRMSQGLDRKQVTNGLKYAADSLYRAVELREVASHLLNTKSKMEDRDTRVATNPDLNNPAEALHFVNLIYESHEDPIGAFIFHLRRIWQHWEQRLAAGDAWELRPETTEAAQ